MSQFNNNLIGETSPYLLQHAHNPVNWYPWGDEALRKARDENKPILVSIGYSACHWCHVMERESFEDEATAAIMNEHFINIKIDREERPDLDHIYMDAVQAMTGSGGWPLNVFLTPGGKPFYGGTYFPPRQAFNRPSWKDVLGSVAQSFKEKRHEIDAQAENLTAHLEQANSFGLQPPSQKNSLFDFSKMDEACRNIMKNADTEWGGFGRAPKFPQTFTIQFLLRYQHAKKLRVSRQIAPNGNENEKLTEEAIRQALLSLDRMIEGGIYDQAGGGFARYATDTEWLVPHFEKMLYDNALILAVLSEAYQATKNDRYAEVIAETMEFVQRELTHPGGGFYAALDADSEGVEGKFYVWDLDEVQAILKEDAPVFCEYYDITRGGNWEGSTILRVREDVKTFAKRKDMQIGELKSLLDSGKRKLLAARENRTRPGLDDKIILGWNALMNTAASKAYAATGRKEYRELAVRNMNFLLDKFPVKGLPGFHHTWKKDEAKFPAFLDDYAFLIEALIHLQEITADTRWLEKAEEIAQFVISHFSEPETGFFFYTQEGQTDIIVRKKEVYDGAVPSGNAVMAYNLYQLAILFDREEWKQRSIDMVGSIGQAAVKYPTSFGVWAGLLLEITDGTNEIAVTGKNFGVELENVLSQYIPHRVIMATSVPVGLPLLTGKNIGEVTTIYLCKNYSCRQPVRTAGELITLIDSSQAAN